MTELERLIAKAERIAQAGERLSVLFAAELAEVWRRFERLVTQDAAAVTSGSMAAMRDRVRRLLTEAGYDVLVAASVNAGVTQMAAIVGTSAIPRTAMTTRLAALQEMSTLGMVARGDEAATAVWRAVAQHAITNRPIREILEDVAKILDRDVKSVRTQFDTQVSIFGRQVEAIQTAGLPDEQPFLYLGPVDFKTRPFCLNLVGKVFTREEIDAMDNGQMPDVFLTGGGYQCRHSWLAVESRAMRQLTNTGERTPQYIREVERLREANEARRRKRGS